MRVFVLAINILVSLVVAQAQESKTFADVYNFDITVDAFSAVAQTSDNGYLVSGFTDDYTTNTWYLTLSKYNEKGIVEWRKFLDEGMINFYNGNEIIPLSDGNYALLTTVNYTDGSGDADLRLFKLDAFGDTIFTRKYSLGAEREGNRRIIETYDKGLCLTGFSASDTANDGQGYVVKTDPLGNVEWENVYGGTGSETIESIVQLQDSGYLAVGRATSYGTDWYDTYLLRLDKNGNELWHKVFDGGLNNYDTALDIEHSQDGNFLVTGIRFYNRPVPFSDQSDSYVMKIDTNGVRLWEKRYGGDTLNDQLEDIFELSDGNIVVSGSSRYFSSGEGTDMDGWLMKLNPSGGVIWSKTYTWDNNPNDDDEYFWGMTLTNDGGFAIVGSIFPSISPSGTQDAWFIKLDSLGDCDSLQCYAHNVTTTAQTVYSNQLEIAVVPNPIRNSGYIQVNGTETFDEYSLRIFDAYGRVIYREQTTFEKNSTNIPLEVSNWQNGMYFYQISNLDNENISGKFLVE